jgi:hypothetical protein
MRYTTRILTVVWLCALTQSCKRPDPIHLQPTIEEPATLVSTIRIADPSTSSQLLRGFYPLEANTWRWAAGKFSVVFGAPATARKNGAWLVLAFNLPDASIQTLKKITLRAKTGDVELSPEEYTTPGEHQYRREVPASALSKDVIEVDFTLDKFLNLPNDGRELGLVVTQIGLEAK